MDENFQIIYNILRRLERSMDCAEFDPNLISAEAIGVTTERWKHIMELLVDEGFIKGVSITRDMVPSTHITMDCPRITLKGLEYLAENTTMQRLMKTAKGIKESIPGL